MDWNKKTFVERFAQSVAHHGSSLITLTKEEQGVGEGTMMDFLSAQTAGNQGWNYLKNVLQMSWPLDSRNQICGSPGDEKMFSCENMCPVNYNYQMTGLKEADEEFQVKVQRFIASKADLLFSMKGKEKLRRGVDYGVDSNQEVLDLYATTPALEMLMDVPPAVRKTELLKCLNAGDVVIGKVTSKRPFGIMVTLNMLQFGCNRDFTDLNIQALCKTFELETPEICREYKDPTDTFSFGDIVRGVITSVDVEDERVSISFRQSRLPSQHKDLSLGVIEDPETVLNRCQSFVEGLSYDEYLNKHKGFNNPRSIETLVELVGVDTTAPCSLLRSFQRCNYAEGDYAEPLRKKQSAKWSMETTAKGVDHFKSGSYDTALKYFEHALQIDSENVEALVARGALNANQDKLTSAIKDFRAALVICPNHKNAHKYLTDTLVEQGIQQEKEGMLNDAKQSFRDALELEVTHSTARKHLEKVQNQIAAKEQKKAQTTTKRDKGLKSRFSHVRELILEEQSMAKKKKKKKERKKKKAKARKKKKKNRISRGRRRSRHSSSSDYSSSESSSLSSSSDSEVWIEKTTATTADQGENKTGEKSFQENRANTLDEENRELQSVVQLKGEKVASNVAEKRHKTNGRPPSPGSGANRAFGLSSGFIEGHYDSERKKRGRESVRRSFSSSSSSSYSRSPSSDREKGSKRNEAHKKDSRNRGDDRILRANSSRKRKIETRGERMQEEFNDKARRRSRSPQKEPFTRGKPFSESEDFLGMELKKIRGNASSASCNSGGKKLPVAVASTAETSASGKSELSLSSVQRQRRGDGGSSTIVAHPTGNKFRPASKPAEYLKSQDTNNRISKAHSLALVSYDYSSDENSSP